MTAEKNLQACKSVKIFFNVIIFTFNSLLMLFPCGQGIQVIAIAVEGLAKQFCEVIHSR